MLVTLVDAAGASHIVAWQGQDQINDFSGVLEAGAVGGLAEPQQVAPANSLRAGWLFQNTSQNAMLLIESVGDAAYIVAPGAFFPPYAGFPIPTGEIQVQGNLGTGGVPPSQAGDTYTYREWINGANE